MRTPMAVGGAVIGTAWATGALPGAPHVPNALSLVTGNPLAAAGVAAGLVAVAWIAWVRFAAQLRPQLANVARGVAVLRTPARYLQTVVSVQAAAWVSPSAQPSSY